MRKTYIVESYYKIGNISSENEKRSFEMYGESDTEIITAFCNHNLIEFSNWKQYNEIGGTSYFLIRENGRKVFQCEL